MIIDEIDLLDSETKKKIIFNNFENLLINDELPLFGKDEAKITYIDEFKGPFES
jgi:hypothetical protein